MCDRKRKDGILPGVKTGIKQGGVVFFAPPYVRLGRSQTPSGEGIVPILPLGMASLFSYFSSKSDLSCSYYHALDHSVSAIRRYIQAAAPGIVGISCLSFNRTAALAVAQIAKRAAPSCRVILGGIHATFLDEQILRHYPCVDYIVRGEGEVSFYELVEALRRGAGPGSVAGVSFRKGKEVQRTASRPRLSCLDELPLIDYSLVLDSSIRKVYARHGASRISLPVETSRGCPYRCVFCSTVGMWGQRVAFRSVPRVLEQIQLLPDGCQKMYLHDTNLTFDRKYLRGLLAGMKEKKIRIPWVAMARVDQVDEPLLREMKEAGCQDIGFGVESFSGRILRGIGKTYDPELAVHHVNLTMKAGMHATVFLVLGLPGETRETLEETRRHVSRLAAQVTLSPVVCKILPGAPLYDRAIKEGFDESYWLREHGSEDSLPVYEGALSGPVLYKWRNLFQRLDKVAHRTGHRV
jgi:radical SAM superfamily enzyme YgiQ (UPF0313 family)